MTLYQLKVFATVAKLKSFTLAADALRVRQPSATLIIQNLQRELDTKLFERLGNKIRLTAVGQELLREAEAIVARADGIKDKVDEVKGLKKGKIAVGGSGFAASFFLPFALREFQKLYPAINVSLNVERSQVLEKMLLAGDLDIAVLGRPSKCPVLLVEPYQEKEMVFVAPPNHPLTRKRSVPLEIIAKEPLIVSRDGSYVRDMLERKFSERGLPFSPLLEVDIHQLGGRDAEKNAVAMGLGIGFLSRCYVELEVKAGRLKVLKVPELNIKRTICIAVHKNRQSSPHVQVFRDFLKRYKQQKDL